MTAYTLNPRVYAQLEEIYDYTRGRWGEDQADAYLASLFDAFDRIAHRRVGAGSTPRWASMVTAMRIAAT